MFGTRTFCCKKDTGNTGCKSCTNWSMTKTGVYLMVFGKQLIIYLTRLCGKQQRARIMCWVPDEATTIEFLQSCRPS